MDRDNPLRRPELRRDARASALRFALSLALFLAALAAASWIFRREVEAVGQWFMVTLGAPGMLVGAFLADGLHFPLPPQFFLLAGVAAGFSGALTVASVVVGSMLGGGTAYALGRWASRRRFIRKQIRARPYLLGPARLIREALSSYGDRGLVVVALLPLSFWALCTTAGALYLPPRVYGVIACLRIPRLVISYWLVVAFWR